MFCTAWGALSVSRPFNEGNCVVQMCIFGRSLLLKDNSLSGELSDSLLNLRALTYVQGLFRGTTLHTRTHTHTHTHTHSGSLPLTVDAQLAIPDCVQSTVVLFVKCPMRYWQCTDAVT